MKIGIVGPMNPSSLVDRLQEKNIPTINRSATAVNTLARGFLDEGHELWIFTLNTEQSTGYRELHGKNLHIYIIPGGMFPKVCGYHQLVFGQFYQPRRIAKVIRRYLAELDVLHAHWTYEYAKAAQLLSEKIPVFDTVRDWCPYQLTLMKGRSRIDWLLKNVIFKQVMVDKRITFIANSAYTHRMITGAYPEKQVAIIPNSIDKTWILDKKLKDIQHQIVSIANGLCSPRKNIGKLIEAFAEYRKLHPEARLHLVGRYNTNADNFQAWKCKGWLEGVIFHGSINHDQLTSLLDEMAFMVHPSLEETFGNILLEAMSRCVPCIGGEKSGAVADVLGHGMYGLTCDINDAQQILVAMEKMNDGEVYARLQANATRMLRERYASDVVVRQHVKLFKQYIKA